MNLKMLLIALAAGCASALMSAASAAMGVAGVPLFLAASLPVYVAALSWGTKAGMAASISAILVAAVFAGPEFAVVVGLAHTIPASIIGHQANLAQPSENGGGMVWYPISRLLLNLSLLVPTGLVLIGMFAGYSSQAAAPAMVEGMRELLQINPPPVPLSDAELKAAAQKMVGIFPFFFSGMWLVVHILNCCVAGKLARMSGLVARPVDDIPATANLPKIALVVFLVALLLAVLLSGSAQQIAATFAGSLMMALSMVGLAALHLRLRGNSGGIGILSLSYFLIVMFYFPLILFAVGGIMRISNNNSNNMPIGKPD